MSDMPFSCGADIDSIENREIFKLETSKAANIAIALEQSSIPFSAKYGDSEIIVFYDGSYRQELEEVVSKAGSEDYDALLRELKRCSAEGDYTALLPEVAEVLHTTVGTLKKRPLDIQEHLCKAYVDYWQADRYTLHRELDRIVTLGSRGYDDLREYEKKSHTPPKQEHSDTAYITREMQKQAAEEVRRQRRETEKRERQREEERNYRS